LRFIARLPLASALAVTGQLREALAMSEEAEALGRNLPELEAEVGASPYGFLFAQRAWPLAHVGRPGEALRAAERAMEIARERNDSEVLAAAHRWCVLPHVMMGNGAEALAHARRAVEQAEVQGNVLTRVTTLQALGRAHLLAGRSREAIETLTSALATMRDRRAALFSEAEGLALLAEAHFAAGDVERARESAGLALELARRRQLPLSELDAQLALARVLLALAAVSIAGIEETLREAEALVERTEARAHAPDIHLLRGQLARRRGDDAGRRRELDEARRLFVEMGAPRRADEVEHDLVA
jgi:tetratricopeptide (TPR) repeat protein